MSLAAITQAAHEVIARHTDVTVKCHPDWRGPVAFCEWCGEPSKCPDRVAAERVVQLAADVAATHEKIREHAAAITTHPGPTVTDTGHILWSRHTGLIRGEAQAILGLLEPAEHTPADQCSPMRPATKHDWRLNVGRTHEVCVACLLTRPLPAEHTHEETT